MGAIIINGGRPLRGTVEISGSKNAALPIIAATVLHGGTYELRNCPDIADVRCACAIVEELGGHVTKAGQSLYIDTGQIFRKTVPEHLMKRMRASVLFLGPLLGRFGSAELTLPGGCPLGCRPVDLHLEAVAAMGAAVTLREGTICCHGPRLHGCCIDLRFPSVGATENALMAAAACHGTVTIKNAAGEPEICDLIAFLQAMGAQIRGGGTSELTITGGAPLRGVSYTVMPDRMETATYLCATAGCGGEVLLLDGDGSCLEPVIEVLTRSGCDIRQRPEGLYVKSTERLRASGHIETAPYPGFPTDAQAPLMAAFLRAKGALEISEHIFEDRFGHVPQLLRFGARIELAGNCARVRGADVLRPARVEACDLRAAAALILAALQAEGESVVSGAHHLYRGYDDPVRKFTALGASIRPAR
ncbi:MAG: UDP-N-acetylglucosamine 1-carboxyvinyltransferase [Oscillospiraceae bacterium]|nr:UDP-N-acetylglucosamine 1-carboxyvinyltransferase [Oscillospiraceae bacterium]